MPKRIDVGDKVLCRLFNTPEDRFYGETWVGEVRRVEPHNRVGKTIRPYLVTRPPELAIWLSRKEIKKRQKGE
jgi:hypothetical protein